MEPKLNLSILAIKIHLLSSEWLFNSACGLVILSEAKNLISLRTGFVTEESRPFANAQGDRLGTLPLAFFLLCKSALCLLLCFIALPCLKRFKFKKPFAIVLNKAAF